MLTKVYLTQCVLLRYHKINPELKVPAFTIGDQSIAESLVIIEYINDRFPEKK